eukprot:2190327-Pyramimonas_sp.AAC.1
MECVCVCALCGALAAEQHAAALGGEARPPAGGDGAAARRRELLHQGGGRPHPPRPRHQERPRPDREGARRLAGADRPSEHHAQAGRHVAIQHR